MTEFSHHMPERRRKKTQLRIPESHSIYLCPNSCGRRQGIRAILNGEVGSASFLAFSQADVALGDYVGQIEEAVGEVLSRLSPRPRVITLYVTCIDDFLGTDADALIEDVSARYPDVRFLLSRINPISGDMSDDVVAVARGIQVNLYAALEPSSTRDAGLNVVGSFEAIPEDGELAAALEAAGAGPLRQLLTCSTFDEYASMANSRCTLSLAHVGDGAAESMIRLGIPWLTWHACYDAKELCRRYVRLAQILGGPPLPCDERVEKVERAVGRARESVGDAPIAVDTSASFMPFSLASTLLGYGFNVRAVFSLHSKGCDDDARARLESAYPDVLVLGESDCRGDADFGIPRESIAIGRDAARLLQSRAVVDMYHDEGYFGFEGIVRLMDEIRAAWERRARR